MNTPIDNETRRKRIEMAVKIGALGLVGFFVAPFILIAVKGILGLALAAGISFSLIYFTPVMASMLANWRLKAIKAEASRNPVETLQNDFRAKSIALDDRKTNIEKLNGQIRTFSDKVDGIKDKYGDKDSAYLKMSRDLLDLRRIYKNRCEKWNEAHTQLGLFEEQIERAGMIWDAANAASAARETSGLTEDEFFAKLRTETAFDAIQNNYNQALASLDTAMIDTPTPEEVESRMPQISDAQPQTDTLYPGVLKPEPQPLRARK